MGQEYVLESEIVALSESRRTESYWTITTFRRSGAPEVVATMPLHQGALKESYPGG